MTRQLSALELQVQRFAILVNSDGELEQGIRPAYLLLDEHRRLQGMSRFRTTAHFPRPRCSSTFTGNRVGGNLVVRIDETKTIEERLNANRFGRTNRFAQQLLACHFCVIDRSSRITEEALRVTIATKPIDENPSIYQNRGEMFPRLVTHPMLSAPPDIPLAFWARR